MSEQPATEHPLPDGQVETLGGRSVHWAEIPGEAAPVLLLGGCGVPYTLWQYVVDGLNGRLMLLDRPGMAGSRWPRRLPLLSEEVATLAAMIDRIGAPTVVVGHSMGGPHAEALARVHPDLVSGVVLVDGSMSWHPRPSRLERAWLVAARAVQASMHVPPLQAVAVAADKAMISAQSVRTQVALMPPWAGWAFRDPDGAAMVIAEQAAYGRQLTDLGDLRAAHPWPDVPTIVLTAVGDGNPGWEADQARYARLLGAEHWVLPDSRHLIMLDRPEKVIEAIARLRP